MCFGYVHPMRRHNNVAPFDLLSSPTPRIMSHGRLPLLHGETRMSCMFAGCTSSAVMAQGLMYR